MTEKSETELVLQSVEGGDALLDWFSSFEYRSENFPDFGDAEVVSFHLRRRNEPGELVLHLKRRATSAIVTFIIGDWIDARLSGFSHQNVISGMIIRHAGERDIAIWEQGVGCKPGLHEFELFPCFGANGIIRGTLQKVRMQLV